MSGMSEMDALIDKEISRVFVSDDQHSIYFDTDSGVVGYSTEGDCCSESWFADITGVDAILGAVVLRAETLAMDDPSDERSRQEYDQAYGYQLTTARGRCVIVFRNSSNGYYGGWMEGPVEGAEIPSSAVEITDDWSA